MAHANYTGGIRRRIMMANQKNNEERFLKHWWSGKDALVNGVLVDRCGSGVDWEMIGSPVWDGTQYIFDNTSKYARVPIDLFDLGNHFKVYLDGDLNNSIYDISSTFFDIGSVTNAARNIGFQCVNGLSINWKMKGNNSNPGLNKNADPNYPVSDSNLYIEKQNKWIPFKCSFFILDRGNDYDKVVIQNFESVYEYTADVPKVAYKNFNALSAMPYALLSRGITNGYGTGLKLRELKIYVYD